MWQLLQGGALWHFAPVRSWPARFLALLSTSCAAAVSCACRWNKPRSSRPDRSAPSVARLRLRTRLGRIASAPVLLRLTSLVVLSTTALPGCSTGWFGARPATPPECPIAQCLDRALKLAPLEGVLKDPQPTRTCADAAVLAADALSVLRVERTLHAELIACFAQHNKDVEALNDAARR